VKLINVIDLGLEASLLAKEVISIDFLLLKNYNYNRIMIKLEREHLG